MEAPPRLALGMSRRSEPRIRPLALRLAAALVLAAAAPVVSPAPARAATLDPNVKMHTIETPHFRVNYPEGYDRIAQKGAAFAEEAHDLVAAYFKTVPKNKTEFTIFDHEDTVNGLALPYVNNAMYVYLTTPDADLMWGRYDDWFKLVITHEYTHVLHFETTDGASEVVNNIFGRMLFPNLFQPTFLIEGLAVTTESMWTSQGKGGRGHDGYFDMYLRGDVLEGRQLSIDQAGGYYLTDFPGGDAPYVYGTFFYKYMVQTYGADKPPLIAREYSKAPWLGIDAAVAKVIPGRDTQQIWDEMLHWLRRRAAAQLAEIRKKPVTRTKAVTTTAYHHRHPAYLPNGRLIFVEGLRHEPTALKELVGWENGQPVLKKIMNKGQFGDYDITRDGKYLYYANSHGRNNYSSYEDVFRRDLETGEVAILTDFARIGQPGVSPDGNWILAVQNGKGNNNLVLLDKAGKLVRRLTALDDNTQFTAPRWSPDGSKIVLSAWRGASRDLYMVDTTTWQTYPLWKDDAVDGGPIWSPDGQHVIFASDREGGVFNLFAYDWKKREIWQISNVLTGVYEPAVSPDQKEIAMAYCRGVGFDIHTMPYDPTKWWKVAPPAVDPTIKPFVWVQKEQYPSHPYSALPSLTPKFWSPLYQSSPASIGVFTIGYDVLITNTVFAHAGWSLAGDGYTDPTSKAFVPLNPIDRVVTTFLYENSQNDVNWRLFAATTPVKYGLPLNNGTTLDLYQHFVQGSFSLGFNNVPSPLTNASYQSGDTQNLGYNVRLIRDLTPADLNKEAVDAKFIPKSGRSHSISYTYKYNDNGKYGYSISPEYGAMTTYGAEVSHPWLGSEDGLDFYRAFTDRRWWIPTGLTHHVIGLRGLLGLNLGKPQGDFYLGGNRSVNQNGTPDIRVAGDPDDVLVALRGYPLGSAGGNTVGLLSGEYRFPIMELQHGPGTLPLFAERLAGVGFADLGTGFTNNWLSLVGRTADKGAKAYPALDDLRASVGAELRLNFKIANNPLNTTPLATIARQAVPALNAFNDSSGIFRLGVAQPVLPVKGASGAAEFLGPTVFTEFGTYF